MSHRLRLVTVLTLFAMAPAALADTPTVDPRIQNVLTQLGKVKSIRAAQLSPDARQLAWVVETDDKPGVQIADADGSHVRAADPSVKSGSCSQDDIAWAPDSRHLAYISDCRGAERKDTSRASQIVLVDSQGQTSPKTLTTLNGNAQALSWSSDGSRLAFLYVEGATRRASAVSAAKPASGEIGVDGLEVQRVATVAADGGATQILTSAASYVYEYSWSPDAQRIAYVSAPAPGDNNWWVAKLYVQKVQANATPSVLVDPGSVSGDLHGLQIALPRWSPDGSRIAFIGGLMSDQGSTGGDIYAVSSRGGSPTDLTPGIHVSPAWLSWNSDRQLLVAQVHGGESEVAEYRVDGDKAVQERVLLNVPASIGDGSADMALSLSRDHVQVAFVHSSYADAPEVYAGALGTTAPKAVSTINAALKPTWGKAESIRWNNEGRQVQGWLLYPVDYAAGKSYPMIVMVHGGPSAATMPRWPSAGFGPAPLSALGYFVLMPNPRGSFGQGEAFVQANRKDFGYGDLRDTLAGVDAVEKKLPVDDKRLGLTGWSYGGFMSMFAPTQTQRFRAVVAGAGISNWQSYYGENLIDQWMIPFFGMSVYDDPAVYAKSSAINFVKQIRTPMLIVVGDRDAECPAPQSFELWHALRAQGVPTSLVVYSDEGHHFVDPAHQRDVLQRALSWFEKYLPASR